MTSRKDQKSQYFALIDLKRNSPSNSTLKDMYSMSYIQTSFFPTNVHLMDSGSWRVSYPPCLIRLLTFCGDPLFLPLPLQVSQYLFSFCFTSPLTLSTCLRSLFYHSALLSAFASTLPSLQCVPPFHCLIYPASMDLQCLFMYISPMIRQPFTTRSLTPLVQPQSSSNSLTSPFHLMRGFRVLVPIPLLLYYFHLILGALLSFPPCLMYYRY